MSLQFSIKKKLHHFQLNLNATLEAGVHTLFGPSGAGKTMCLKILAGIEDSDAEHIQLGGRLLSSSSQHFFLPPQKRNIGFVFQEPVVFPHMNVFDNVQFGATGSLPTSDALDLLKIGALSKCYAHQLSGGQLQRVAIARVLVGKPELLILDEPFNAIDLPLRLTLREEVKNICSELKIPVILVTHDLTEAISMSDQLLFIDQGEIIQRGNPYEMMRFPINDLVRKYLSIETLISVREI